MKEKLTNKYVKIHEVFVGLLIPLHSNSDKQICVKVVTKLSTVL